MKTWILLALVCSIAIVAVQGDKDDKPSRWNGARSVSDDMSKFDANDDDEVEAKDAKPWWHRPNSGNSVGVGGDLNGGLSGSHNGK